MAVEALCAALSLHERACTGVLDGLLCDDGGGPAASAHVRHRPPTTGFVLLMRLLEQVDRVHLVGFDGFAGNKELHYYRERRLQVEVNAAGALLHDWGREQLGIQRLVDEGRVVLL